MAIPFFPGVACALDLSTDQLTLLEFIKIYEDVDDLDPRERPDANTVEDDAAFDKWVKDFIHRRETEVITGEHPRADQHQSVVKFHGFDEDTEQE